MILPITQRTFRGLVLLTQHEEDEIRIRHASPIESTNFSIRKDSSTIQKYSYIDECNEKNDR